LTLAHAPAPMVLSEICKSAKSIPLDLDDGVSFFRLAVVEEDDREWLVGVIGEMGVVGVVFVSGCDEDEICTCSNSEVKL